MPNCCWSFECNCPCYEEEYDRCKAAHKDCEIDAGEKRPEWCPLIEVKTPHGRLIDADKLHDEMYHRAFETDGDTMWQSGCWVRYRAIEQVQNGMPAVIESED